MLLCMVVIKTWCYKTAYLPICTYAYKELSNLFIYLFIRERGREREREGEKYRCERNIDLLPLVCSDWGPKLQTRLVP